MKKQKAKEAQPSTKAIFDALFERMMIVSTSNGQLIERNKNLREQVEMLSKENTELKKFNFQELAKVQPDSTLQIKGFWLEDGKKQAFKEKAE